MYSLIFHAYALLIDIQIQKTEFKKDIELLREVPKKIQRVISC